MIISLSGQAGSGKSSIANMLAKKLNWPQYYIGQLRRDAALKRGLSLEEYNKLGETDPSTDKEVDLFQEELGKKHDNFIIEGRTSWFFIPHSLKIYLQVDKLEAAKRIFKELQKENKRNENKKNVESIEEMLESISQRELSDNLRYKKYYGINHLNLDNYDFVLDTSNLSQEAVFERVYLFVKNELDKA